MSKAVEKFQKMTSNKKAVILVSGGLDSATVLALALADGYICTALSVNYGQRHLVELECARKLVAHMGVTDHREVVIDIGGFGGSALTDTTIDVPTQADLKQQQDIPITYVPARNTIFLSVALGLAEVLGAQDIFIGANAVDYSGYPDCRPEFINAFEELANLATRCGVEGNTIQIQAPLIDLTKADIIRLGVQLGVDYGLTSSCYNPQTIGNKSQACGECDSCQIREAGFADAGYVDPVRV
jgi:7-cyano-7-deazaguanine synthase